MNSLGVFSGESGVIWPLDSSTTSMKAGVNSADACLANELDPPPYKHTHTIPLMFPPVSCTDQLVLLPNASFQPGLPSHLGPSLFFPRDSGHSKLSDGECYLLIVSHLQNGC